MNSRASTKEQRLQYEVAATYQVEEVGLRRSYAFKGAYKRPRTIET